MIFTQKKKRIRVQMTEFRDGLQSSFGGKVRTKDILPALEDFPGGSPEDDARRVNAILEAHIRKVPEQYYWLHRRFKGRPEGYADPYPG